MIISDHLTNGMKVSIIVSFTALFFVAWSCGTDSPVEDEPAPEPTGEEVWNLLQQENETIKLFIHFLHSRYHEFFYIYGKR